MTGRARAVAGLIALGFIAGLLVGTSPDDAAHACERKAVETP
jgi:hypothetical protein